MSEVLRGGRKFVHWKKTWRTLVWMGPDVMMAESPLDQGGGEERDEETDSSWDSGLGQGMQVWHLGHRTEVLTPRVLLGKGQSWQWCLLQFCLLEPHLLCPSPGSAEFWKWHQERECPGWGWGQEWRKVVWEEGKILNREKLEWKNQVWSKRTNIEVQKAQRRQSGNILCTAARLDVGSLS